MGIFIYDDKKRKNEREQYYYSSNSLYHENQYDLNHEERLDKRALKIKSLKRDSINTSEKSIKEKPRDVKFKVRVEIDYKNRNVNESFVYGMIGNYILILNAPEFNINAEMDIDGNSKDIKNWQVGFVQNVISHESEKEYRISGKKINKSDKQYLDCDKEWCPWYDRGSVFLPSEKGKVNLILKDTLSNTVKIIDENKMNLLNFKRVSNLSTWLLAKNIESGEIKYLYHINWKTTMLAWSIAIEKKKGVFRAKFYTDIIITNQGSGKGINTPILTGTTANEELGKEN